MPEPPPEHENSELLLSGPSNLETADLHSVHSLQNVDQPLNLDLGDDIDAEGETDSDALEESQPSRPNRFEGPRQTWRGYTVGERQIVASLEQIENSDLAAHLYNAHALRRRAQRSAAQQEGLKDWQSRDRWLKPDSQLQFKDALGLIQVQLVPSNDWTAWPLSRPDFSIFRHQFGRQLAHAKPGEWMIGGTGQHNVGEDLKDELLATFLRLAKDTWVSRETETDALWKRSRSRSRSQSQSRSVISSKSHRSASQNIGARDMRHTAKDVQSPRAPKKRGPKPKVEVYLEATILADDAEAQRLLQPTIQSILSQLDELALAIRRTRLNHLRHGGDDGMSTCTEYTTDAETDRPRSRSRSRSSLRTRSKSRTRSRSATARKRSSQRSSRASSVHTSSRKSRQKKISKGAKKESESGAAISSSSDSARSRNTIRPQKRRRAASITSDDSTTSSRDQSGRVGLMDWSEVLGIAAVKGWDAGAVARTAQRCAALFGESMSFIPLEGNLSSKTIPERVQFTPSTIPPPDALSAPKGALLKRPLFQYGTQRCPHVGCKGNKKKFTHTISRR